MSLELITTLIVDDEPTTRMSLRRVVDGYKEQLQDNEQEVQFVVHEAESVEEARQKISEVKPDLLLLDHKLPGMTGMEFIEELVKAPSSLPVIVMITAYGSIEMAVRATKQGAYDFLAKPFTPQELRKVALKAADRVISIRQSKMLARERKRVRFEFIRMVGHELKAPLAAVESYMELISRKMLGPDLVAYDEIVERSLLRLGQMRKLITDILDMTKIESGVRERKPEPVPMRAVVDQAIEVARLTAQKRGISIELHMDNDFTFRTDRAELDMILNNLISNAVKYNRENGRVDVSVDKLEDGMQIAVKDTGIGMTEAEQAKLFKEFSRIKNEKTRGILGSGLGLMILKQLVDLNGGVVSVQSVPGEGSVFTCLIREG